MKRGEQPVSRVWACVFSFSIFAVLWTNTMKKTRRWAVLFSLLVLVPVGDVMLYAYDDDYRYYSDRWDSPIFKPISRESHAGHRP